MDDLPHSHAVHEYDGHKITLMYSEDHVGRWEVYVGAKYMGVVFETHTGAEDGYAARQPGDEDDEADGDTTDNWPSAVHFLIDSAD